MNPDVPGQLIGARKSFVAILDGTLMWSLLQRRFGVALKGVGHRRIKVADSAEQRRRWPLLHRKGGTTLFRLARLGMEVAGGTAAAGQQAAGHCGRKHWGRLEWRPLLEGGLRFEGHLAQFAKRQLMGDRLLMDGSGRGGGGGGLHARTGRSRGGGVGP